MKKTLIAISVACVGALASMAGVDTAGSGAYESLKFATNIWFTVTNGTSGAVVEGGEITGTLTPSEDDFLNFDTTESGVPVVFKAADDNERTNDITTVTFDVKAATVPNGKLAAVSAATNAVCLYESATDPAATNFCVKVSGGANWVQMGSTKVPFEGDAYKLVARFDNRAEAKKIQFAAIVAGEEVVLTNATVTDGWLTYTADVDKQINVGLLGKGALKALRGDQLVIIAEVIVIPEGGGKIEVDEKDLEVFEAESVASGKSVGEYLSSNAQETYAAKKTKIDAKLTVAQAYALGLVKSEDGELVFPNNGELDVKAEAAAVDDQGNIKVGFVDVTPNVKSGASFSYQLMKSRDGSTDSWQPSGDPVYDLDAVKIPGTDVTAGYHYFKVVTTVTLKDAPPETQVEEQN